MQFYKHIREPLKTSFKKGFSEYPLICGFLTNELWSASYELRVTIYCTNYELFFTNKMYAIL